MNWKTTLLLTVAALAVNGLAAESKELPVIAHWSFDNDNGKTSLSDSGPGKLDALIESGDKDAKASTAKGIFGQALTLSGSPVMKFTVQDKDDRLNNLTPPYTICCWIKVTSEKPGSMCVLCHKADSESAGYDLRASWGMVDYRWGNGKDHLSLYSPENTIKLDKWHHIAVSNDGKTLRLFINGDKVTEKAFTNNDAIPVKSAKKMVVIGNYVVSETAYNFVGMIDELYVIGKALSADELFELATPPKE